MANIIGGNISGNKSGGVRTDNPYTNIIGVNITDNGGHGVEDVSGETLVQIMRRMPSALEELKQDISANPVFAKNQAELSKEISIAEDELKTDQPKASVVRKAFERIKDLTKEYAAEAAAKTVVEFVKNAPQLIDACHQAGFLT